eukprot:TRINITY_DN770_c0_g1_i5.p1 TRINITY_DN770_c0_g1~~TRINITY_DN770_c0_g1_i5.p1  ORF type:complete len:138 (+),score=11.61 TRINITY_DN770_c0_g1_i5:421-834(+)
MSVGVMNKYAPGQPRLSTWWVAACLVAWLCAFLVNEPLSCSGATHFSGWCGLARLPQQRQGQPLLTAQLLRTTATFPVCITVSFNRRRPRAHASSVGAINTTRSCSVAANAGDAATCKSCSRSNSAMYCPSSGTNML